MKTTTTTAEQAKKIRHAVKNGTSLDLARALNAAQISKPVGPAWHSGIEGTWSREDVRAHFLWIHVTFC